jgi:BCCIP
MGSSANNERGMSEAAKPPPDDTDDEDAVSSEESEDDDLVLEGVVVRNPDVSDESEDDDEEDSKVAATMDTTGSKRKAAIPDTKADAATKKQPKSKKKKKKNEPDTIEVDFTFCDMDEKYFHGLKSLLHSSSTVYQEHSSALADLMIENMSVGTIVGTSLEDSKEADVFGFASVLNVTTYQQSPAIQFLKTFCLNKCPAANKKELEVALSGKTNRPAGFFLHGRMVNMPLEIVNVLHQQLVLDMDWAVDNAEDQVERKSLDFGAFIRLAPCQQEGAAVFYKYFDDEIFASNAEFVYTVDAPKSFSKEDKQLINIMVLTKTGHRAAMNDLSKLINGQ